MKYFKKYIKASHPELDFLIVNYMFIIKLFISHLHCTNLTKSKISIESLLNSERIWLCKICNDWYSHYLISFTFNLFTFLYDHFFTCNLIKELDVGILNLFLKDIFILTLLFFSYIKWTYGKKHIFTIYLN